MKIDTMTTTQQVCIADWDGTLSRGYTALHWLEFLSASRAINDQFLEEFHRCLHLYEEKELSYRSLVTMASNIVASSLKGIEENKILEIAEDFKSKAKEYIFPFLVDLIKFLTEKGISIIVISGAPRIALQPICSELGIDELYAVELGVDAQRLMSGRVKDNYGLLEKKQEIVEAIMRRNVEIILGLGNSGFDLPILEAARNKVFVNAGGLPKPITNIQLVSSSNAFDHIKTIL